MLCQYLRFEKDKSSWERVRFGDVVDNLNETCDPTAAEVGTDIGLEHLEPGSLHVHVGQRRRRHHLHSPVPTRGTCSSVNAGPTSARWPWPSSTPWSPATFMCCPPKGTRLLPELLPFICMSETVLQVRRGNFFRLLSPRTNWSHLAKFEFDLPPMDRPRRIAEILWAVDKAR